MDSVPAPNHQSCLQRFYEPVVLENALIKACRASSSTVSQSSMVENDSLLNQCQAFQCFVYKLAQICDNERGGATVTAFTVLRRTYGPEYVFGSNRRDLKSLTETKAFIGSLLSFVSANRSNMNQKPLTKQVLWRILLFNISRVEAYLNNVARYIELCIADWRRRQISERKGCQN